MDTEVLRPSGVAAFGGDLKDVDRSNQAGFPARVLGQGIVGPPTKGLSACRDPLLASDAAALDDQSHERE